MASPIKEQLLKLADHIPGLRLRRNAMAEVSKPNPTDNIAHRYEDPAVLRKALIEMGFKDEDIKIWATEAKGLDVQLPRELTSETISKKFEEAAYAKRAAPKKEEDGDD
ncbi:hypothetical protein CHU98_g4762 [Xylaria longipes]|nr:hypothetical protein CHU98_g4762 [Xylaria longipes]